MININPDNNFSLISQWGFNQKPFLSQITSTLTYELDKSLLIILEIVSCVFLDCNSLINLTRFGNFIALSFVIKHLNLIACPPDAMPSLNSAAPPSIALVPS